MQNTNTILMFGHQIIYDQRKRVARADLGSYALLFWKHFSELYLNM